MHLWEKAARIDMYVQNRTPHRVLDNKTTKENFSGEKSEVSHLKIFGHSVYIHIPKEKMTKLEPFGRRGIFVGYIDTSNSYRIHFPGFKKIEINRDVTFDEDLTYIRSRRLPIQEVEEPEEMKF